VHVYDILLNKNHEFAPDRTAFEGFNYTFTKQDGSTDSELEEILSTIENSSSHVFDDLISGSDLDQEKRGAFSVFLASMIIRTDAFRRMYAELMIKVCTLSNC
jgi:hypothetical protein